MVNYRFLSCFFSFSCFLLLLVAHCSHSWRTYHPFEGVYSMGLWTICSDMNGCQKLNAKDVRMEFTRAFMVLALITSFLAAAWAVEWEHLFYCNFIVIPKALMASIWNLVTAISVLIALMMFEIESPHVPVKKTSSKGWAFYLSSVIGVLCFVIAHFDFVAYKCLLWGKRGSHIGVGPEEKHTTESLTVAPALL